jgi:hypothetical protein
MILILYNNIYIFVYLVKIVLFFKTTVISKRRGRWHTNKLNIRTRSRLSVAMEGEFLAYDHLLR